MDWWNGVLNSNVDCVSKIKCTILEYYVIKETLQIGGIQSVL